MKPTSQTVPPLTISKTATGASIKKITIPDPSNLHPKVVSAGNQLLTKVVTTNPPNPTVKVINAPTVAAKRIELNSKTLAAVKNSISTNNAAKSGIIIVDGNKKFNITKPAISNQIGNAVQKYGFSQNLRIFLLNFVFNCSLPSGATITRVIQRKRPPLVTTKLTPPPQKKRKVEVTTGAGTSGGPSRITIKSKLVVFIRCVLSLVVNQLTKRSSFIVEFVC